jgi:hypothetical protein
MRFFPLDRQTKFLLLAAFMVLSIVALPQLPFMAPWGLDLQNVHAFQRCAAGRSPYLVDAAVCGDALARPFYYPPFLFAFFRWLRPLTLETAMYIWTAFLLTSATATFYLWARKISTEPLGDDRHEIVAFCALLLFQYPFVFALERGNTDSVNLLFYTLGAFLFVRRREWLAGMSAGVAAGFKLSPIIAIVVMTGALFLGWRRVGRWAWARFAGGSLAAFLLTLLVFFGDAKIYLFDVLPKYARSLSFGSEYSHSLPTYVGDSWRLYGKLMSVALLAPWVWGMGRAVGRGELAMAFAGALAVSTYVQGTSFDYNLITTYPLLLLLFIEARRTDRWGLLVFGLFAIIGDRRLFTTPGATILTPNFHFVLELAFLVVAGLSIGRGREVRPAAPAPA